MSIARLSPEAAEQGAALALPSDLALVLRRIASYARWRGQWLQGQRDTVAPESARGGDEHARIYRDDPLEEQAWRHAHPMQACEEIDSRLQRESEGRLAQLCELFRLAPEDCDLLHTCIAVALEPNLTAALAWLQGHSGRDYVSEYLVARLFGYGHYFPLSSESPLICWGLVQASYRGPGEPQGWQVDPQILRWLLGYQDLHPALVGLARLQEPASPLEGWPVQETVDFLTRIVNTRNAQGALVQVSGAAGSGKKVFCACVASQLGLPTLVIDSDDPELFVWAQRQAFLDRSALVWTRAPRSSGRVPLFPVQFIIADEHAGARGTDRGSPAQPSPSGQVVCQAKLPQLSRAQRESLWCAMLPGMCDWAEDDVAALLRRHVQVGDIAAIAAQGMDDYRSVNEALSARQRDQFEGLAEVIPCPFERDDLILASTLQDALEDFLFEAGERDRFWQDERPRRLFPRGQGLVALFSGPPGTGKTMAAQVVAAALGMDLLRVDLSSVVSKYVGETSQNLSRIIRRAANMDAVLLFDEADALFSKRTEVKDAHDRFANSDTNYLLQAIENFPGIAILATNKKSNLDSAFIRRLRFLLEFNAPDYPQRLRLWQVLVNELADDETAVRLGAYLERLARQLSITGAQIKFAILAALFTARRLRQPLAIDHLLQGIDRELIKEGRALSEQEREALRR